MELRKHPEMTYRGLRNWPPVWVSSDKRVKRPTGEVGVLVEVAPSKIDPENKCFLTIKHNGAAYTGCLLFDDGRVGQKVSKLLRRHLRYPIEFIGGIDL